MEFVAGRKATTAERLRERDETIKRLRRLVAELLFEAVEGGVALPPELLQRIRAETKVVPSK